MSCSEFFKQDFSLGLTLSSASSECSSSAVELTLSVVFSFFKRTEHFRIGEGSGIELYHTPTQKSEVNGQVERFHSTFMEIYRCLKGEYPTFKTTELIAIVVDRYNNTVPSVTNRNLVDIFFFNRTSRINYQGLADFKHQTLEDIRGLIEHKQNLTNNGRNKNRSDPLSYEPGDTVYVANKQI